MELVRESTGGKKKMNKMKNRYQKEMRTRPDPASSKCKKMKLECRVTLILLNHPYKSHDSLAPTLMGGNAEKLITRPKLANRMAVPAEPGHELFHLRLV